jgi:hypothetical protein
VSDRPNIPPPDELAAVRECSEEGCGKRHFARGLCKKHYDHAKNQGALPGARRNATPEDAWRFIAKATQHQGNDCLLYPFARHDGYPKISSDGRNRSVHQIICERVHGDRPSRWHQVAHSRGDLPCVSLRCVNPQHLRWVLPVQNSADSIKHGTAVKGEHQHLAKLTVAQVLEIRAQPTRSLRDLADEFNVANQTVRAVRNRTTWRHI